MTIHLLTAFALAQAQPARPASAADIACVTTPIAPADHEGLLDEVLANRTDAPVRGRLIAAAEACAGDGGWSEERRRQAGRMAAVHLVANAARVRLARQNFDAARIDRWIERQSAAGPMPAQVDRAQSEAIAAALAAEGAPIRDEAQGNLVGIYLQAQVFLSRHRAGLVL